MYVDIVAEKDIVMHITIYFPYYGILGLRTLHNCSVIGQHSVVYTTYFSCREILLLHTSVLSAWLDCGSGVRNLTGYQEIKVSSFPACFNIILD